MLKRVLTAVVAIPVFLGVMWYSGTAFAGLMLALSALAALEYVMAMRRLNRPVSELCALVGPATVFVMFWTTLPHPAPTYWSVPQLQMTAEWNSSPSSTVNSALLGAALLFLGVLVELKRGSNKERPIAQAIGAGLLCAVWTAMFSAPVVLRNWHDVQLRQDSVFDVNVIVLTTLCVWAADSFALFGGMAFGKRKMAPLLSPNKTWEGAISGLLVSVAVGIVLGTRMLPKPEFCVAIGVIAGVIGPIGDLFESAVKRDLGVKDMGGILPGHGGVLDRFDSYLFVCTAVLFYLEVSNLWPR